MIAPRHLPVLLLALLAGCGGGGGGGGGSTGAVSLPPGAFGVVSGPNGSKLAGLNVPVSLSFSKSVDPATVTLTTIKVVTVADPSGISTAPPGHLASVDYSVNGATVKITPHVDFTPAKVEYGFLADALYEIAFAPPGAPVSVESTAGESMGNPNATFFFRTPNKGYDYNPGYPHVRAFVVDDPDNSTAPPIDLPPVFQDANNDGSLVDEVVAKFSYLDGPGHHPVEITAPASPVGLPSTTATGVLFIFDDAVIPTTVVNPLDGQSPAIAVTINTVTPPSFSPKVLPAQYTVIHQQGNLTLVLWQTAFAEFPPGGFLFVEVQPTVQDLAGNSKQSLLASGVADLSASLSVLGTAVASATIEELFSDVGQRDAAATSADWAADDDASGTPAKVLAPVLGGGTGEDGVLVIDPAGTSFNPGGTQVPTVSVVDYTAKTVRLPSVEPVPGGYEPRQWSFSTISIPVGWTLSILFDRDGDGVPDPAEYLVQSPGHPLDGQGAPLLLRCTGQIEILGTIDVSGRGSPTVVRPSGVSDPAYAGYQGQGGAGGQALVAAGDGGRGGDVLLLDERGDPVFPLVSPSPDFQSSDGKLRGVTGRSTGLTDTTLSDAAAAFTRLLTSGDAVSDALAAGEIRLQPNVGVGSSLVGNSGTPNEVIDENHPTFVVDAASVADGTVGVTDEHGSLKQPSKNVGDAYAPIASAGDGYLVGRLQGRVGGDPTVFGRGGKGAEPYVVVNEGALGVTTTGGGGGGLLAGQAGQSDGPDSDPDVNQRGGSHGISKDDSVGAAGGDGAVQGIATCNGTNTMMLVSQSAGRPLPGLASGELVGSFLIPNSPNDGWMFRIAGFDGLIFTVDSITAGEEIIDLLDGPGAGGPQLSPGADYGFVVMPSLQIGGGGGGGSGVSITGTVNSSPSVLPQLAPGAGGGSGGGSLLLETASSMVLGPLCRLLAEGGPGGSVFNLQAKYAGGGGGAGGNVVVRAGKSLDLFLGARVSVAGGAGGSEAGSGLGGAGGPGFIRFENFDDTLTPAVLTQFTTPAVAPMNVGRMLGELQGVGQSLFYQTPFVNPEWTSAQVEYFADTDGDLVTQKYVWAFGDTGAVSTDGSGGAFPDGLAAPPVRLQFNSVGFDADGFLDASAKSDVFYEAYDLVSARVGLAYDPGSGVLLYCVGEGAHAVHRLDVSNPLGPNDLKPVASGPAQILFPTIPSAGSSTINVLAIAAGGPDNELFVLERDTSRVHVISLTTGGFRRTIQLPSVVTGAMTYLPDIDRLVVADNRSDQLLVFRPRDPGGSLSLDYSPAAAEAQYHLLRDGDFLDAEIVGLAYDAASQRLWCSDARAGRLFAVSFAPGSEGLSASGLDAFSPLVFDAAGAPPPVPVVPSATAFDGSRLYLVHAIDRSTQSGDPDSGPRVQGLLPSAVDPAGSGAATVLAGFGVVLPEGPASIADGDPFLRFRLIIDGEATAGSTQFADVSVDAVRFAIENQAF